MTARPNDLDLDALDQLVDSLRSRDDWYIQRQSGRSILESWAEIASTASSGYTGLIDEYINDLGLRYHLDLVLRASTGPLRSALVGVVDRIDEEFRTNTVLVSGGVMRTAVGPSWDYPDRWWLRRVPKDPDLLAELETVWGDHEA